MGATDGNGLTTLAEMTLEVLPPLCAGAAAFEENGACSDCPANHVPNVSKTRCDPCPANSDRASDAAACTACAAELSSSPGEPCDCGTARRLESGTCVDCPPHTDASENPLNCRACPDNQQRPAGAEACENCPAGETSTGGAACEPPSGPRLVLSVASTAVAEDVGSVTVTLTLQNPPSGGKYRNCGLDVVLSGTALQGADFQLSGKTEKLRSADNWTATGTLTILNDALVEGDETLVLVGDCLASNSKADPPHDQLPADELTITITDDESLPTLTLSVAPETIDEHRGAQTVTVTASMDAAPTASLDVPLSFSGSATANEYAVEGVRSVTIAANSLSGSRDLTITPLADQEADDGETIVIGAAVAGYQVTAATLTVREAQPTLALSVDSTTVAEDAGSVSVTLTLENALSGVYRDCGMEAAASGTAAADTDYRLPAANLILRRSRGWVGTAALTLLDDELVEGNETLVLTGVCASSRANSNPAHDGLAARELTLTIADDDSGPNQQVRNLSLSVSPAAATEGTSGSHEVRATLTGVSEVPSQDVVMTLSVGGTATDGVDYRLTGARSLTIAANDATLTGSAAFDVAVASDDVQEGSETIEFSVTQIAEGSAVETLPSTATATVTVVDLWEAPPAPLAVAVAPATSDPTHALAVTWRAPSASPSVTSYAVEHRLPDGVWSSRTVPAPAESTTLTGLMAGTEYQVRVTAVNAAGAGAVSDVAVGRTDPMPCAPGAPGVTAPATGGSTQLDISWTAAACGAGVIDRYEVRHRENPQLEDEVSGWRRQQTAGLTASLQGLAPDTAYEVQVRAVSDTGGNSRWSASGFGSTTVDPNLPPRPGTPEVVGGDRRVSFSWGTVSWTDPATGAASPIASYRHRHRVADGAWSIASDKTATAAELSAGAAGAVITGLEVGTWHEVQVRAVNRAGGDEHPGKWSPAGRAHTHGAPDRVAMPAAFRDGGMAEVLWEAPDNGGSSILDYDVHYRRTGAASWLTHPFDCGMASPCATETTVSGLETGASYEVEVLARNAVGSGEWSPPAPVQSIKLLRASFGAAQVAVGEGGSATVNVHLNKNADRDVTVGIVAAAQGETATTDYTIQGLTEGGLTFLNGTMAQSLTVLANQDADLDDEQVILGFGALPAGVIRKAPSAVALNIADDDLAPVPDPCPSTTEDNCELAATASGGSSGACATGYNGACVYACDNGDWERTSNTCARPPACGASDELCELGTSTDLNDTLSPDTHRWRCVHGTSTQACEARADVCPSNKIRVLKDTDSDGALERICELCGTNEAPDNDQTSCECAAGHHRHNGACVPNPVCASSLAAAPTSSTGCTVGNFSESPDDLEEQNGVCGVEENACAPGELEDIEDSPAVHRVCGSRKDSCVPSGGFQDIADSSTRYRWRCVGESGRRKWRCNGAEGEWRWSCANGGVTESACAMGSGEFGASSGLCSVEGDPGRGATCSSPKLPVCGADNDECDLGRATDLNDTLIPDSHRWRCVNGTASTTCDKEPPACQSDEIRALRNADGDSALERVCESCGTNEAPDADQTSCVCAEGHHPHNGACVADPVCAQSLTAAPTGSTGCDEGVFSEPPDDTQPKDGDCGSSPTENQCSVGSPVDIEDLSPVDGVCGMTNEACDPSNQSVDISDTKTHHKWRCEGTDGELRWRCDGLDGAWLWSCASGGETDACSWPMGRPGASDACALPGRAAADAACTKPAPPCPSNEAPVLRNTDGDGALERICVCKDGFHRASDGTCKENPMCKEGTGEPTASNACMPDGASLIDKAHTPPVHGDCGASRNSCDDRSAPVDDPDLPPTIGACGSTNEACAPSAFRDIDDTLTHYKWQCLGASGESRWTCPGTAGNWTWKCRHGDQTVLGCEREDPATPAACSVAVHPPSVPNCTVDAPDCPENARAVLRDIDDNGVLERICECKEAYDDLDPSPTTADCVPKPVCSTTVVNQCDEGSFEQINDSSNPEEHRWKCNGELSTSIANCKMDVNCSEAKRFSNNEWSCLSYAEVNCASSGGTWGAGRCEFSGTSCPAVGWTATAITTTSATTCTGTNLSLLCGPAAHPFSCTTGSHDSTSAAVEQCRYASQHLAIYPGFPSGGCRTNILTCTATVTSVECRACAHRSLCNCPPTGSFQLPTCWDSASNRCKRCWEF